MNRIEKGLEKGKFCIFERLSSLKKKDLSQNKSR